MDANTVYVGRAGNGESGFWGNPFRVTATLTAKEAVAKYRVWLWEQIKCEKVTLRDLARLKGRTLYCPGCGIGNPECHARVLERAAKWACRELDARLESR